MSISVDRTVIYVEPSYGEPEPKYAYIKLRYYKKRPAYYLTCRLVSRGVAVTDLFEFDVSSQYIGTTSEYEGTVRIVNKPSTITVLFNNVVPDSDVEQSIPLSENEAMVLIVYGDPSGKLVIKDYTTGNVIKEVAPEDIDGDGFGTTYLVVTVEKSVTLDLVPQSCRYSVYIVPKNVVLYARVGLTLVCTELDQDRSKIETLMSTVSRISVRLSPAPVAVCYISSWDAGV